MKNNLINPEYQEKVFNKILTMKFRIQNLAGYVQNDFEKMLQDGTITKSELSLSIHDMDKSFDSVIADLNDMRESIRNIMNHYQK